MPVQKEAFGTNWKVILIFLVYLSEYFMYFDPRSTALAGIIAQVALVKISGERSANILIRITAAVRVLNYKAVFQNNLFLLTLFSVSSLYRHLSIATLPKFLIWRHTWTFYLDNDIAVSTGLKQLLEEL